jgi:hypothetical protein
MPPATITFQIVGSRPPGANEVRLELDLRVASPDGYPREVFLGQILALEATVSASQDDAEKINNSVHGKQQHAQRLKFRVTMDADAAAQHTGDASVLALGTIPEGYCLAGSSVELELEFLNGSMVIAQVGMATATVENAWHSDVAEAAVPKVQMNAGFLGAVQSGVSLRKAC